MKDLSDAKRRRVFSRDGYLCCHCRQARPPETLAVHHRKPRRLFSSKAEADRLENLATVCRAPCHQRQEAVSRRLYRDEILEWKRRRRAEWAKQLEARQRERHAEWLAEIAEAQRLYLLAAGGDQAALEDLLWLANPYVAHRLFPDRVAGAGAA